MLEVCLERCPDYDAPEVFSSLLQHPHLAPFHGCWPSSNCLHCFPKVTNNSWEWSDVDRSHNLNYLADTWSHKAIIQVPTASWSACHAPSIHKLIEAARSVDSSMCKPVPECLWWIFVFSVVMMNCLSMFLTWKYWRRKTKGNSPE